MSSSQIMLDSYLFNPFYPNSRKRKTTPSRKKWMGSYRAGSNYINYLSSDKFAQTCTVLSCGRKTYSRDGCFARVSRIANRLHSPPPCLAVRHTIGFPFSFFLPPQIDTSGMRGKLDELQREQRIRNPLGWIKSLEKGAKRERRGWKTEDRASERVWHVTRETHIDN